MSDTGGDKQKAVTYLRVSGRGQIRGDGFPRQREAVQRYAAANGIDIIAEYRDEGVRGEKDLGSRPGLGALLDHIESNGVRLVLVERADRLARDLLVGEIILADLRKRGVRVLSADGGLDTRQEHNPNDPDAATRTLIRQILGAVAEYDKRVTVWKLAAARQRIRRRDGRCEGKKPFGAKPGEPETIARIRSLRTQGCGYGEIASKLDAEGRPARSGRPWSREAVRSILARAVS